MINQICINCGICFGVPDEWDRQRRIDQVTFYCPNGHQQSYSKGTVEILREQKAQLQREKEASERRLQAQINETQHALLVTQKERDGERRKRRRIEARVSKGVCPCCNRTFDNIQKHMATKHKEYGLPPGSTKQIEGTVQ